MSESQPEADRNFVKNLISARKAKVWSQSQLAEEMTERGAEGINQTAISRIEKEEREVRLSEARLIARIFGTTMDALLGPPEDFADVLEWNRLSGDFASAAAQLRQLGPEYERARRALEDYLNDPKVPLSHALKAAYVDATGQDIVAVCEEILRSLEIRNAAEEKFKQWSANRAPGLRGDGDVESAELGVADNG